MKLRKLSLGVIGGLLLAPISYGAELDADGGPTDRVSVAGSSRSSLGFIEPNERSQSEPVRTLIEPAAPATVISDAPSAVPAATSAGRTAARQRSAELHYSTVRLAPARRHVEEPIRRLPAPRTEPIARIESSERAQTVSAASEQREIAPDAPPTHSKRKPAVRQIDSAPAPFYESPNSSEEAKPEASNPAKGRGNRLKPPRPEVLLGEATPVEREPVTRAPLAERLAAIDAQPSTRRAALEGTIRAVNLESGTVKIAFDRTQPPVGGLVKVYERRGDKSNCLGTLEVTGVHQGLVTARPLDDVDPQALAQGKLAVYCLKPGPDRLSRSRLPEVVWVSDR